MSDFSREAVVLATRKAHVCAACGTHIDLGAQAVRWSGTTDGDFASVMFHPECREAEIALNELHDLNYDEWMWLESRDPEDDEWLIAEHPIVAARLGLGKGDPT